jgi:probable rRNA maturation factor
MSIELHIRNESNRKRMYRGDVLQKLVGRILSGEEKTGEFELSILFCDDAYMAQLNRQYRQVKGTTDVLSFESEPMPGVSPAPIGDIVISLETVETHCAGAPSLMREEVKLLVCHGVLHLLGFDHGTQKEKTHMQSLQSFYLGVNAEEAWNFGSRANV